MKELQKKKNITRLNFIQELSHTHFLIFNCRLITYFSWYILFYYKRHRNQNHNFKTVILPFLSLMLEEWVEVYWKIPLDLI